MTHCQCIAQQSQRLKMSECAISKRFHSVFQKYSQKYFVQVLSFLTHSCITVMDWGCRQFRLFPVSQQPVPDFFWFSISTFWPWNSIGGGSFRHMSKLSLGFHIIVGTPWVNIMNLFLHFQIFFPKEVIGFVNSVHVIPPPPRRITIFRPILFRIIASTQYRNINILILWVK